VNKLNINILMTILMTLLVAACGGGGGGGSLAPQNETQPLPESNTDQGTPVVSSGVITGFGSVFVNGVEFETGGANVSTDDDANASEDDLEVGMVVMITGTVNEDGVTGQANHIEYDEELQGVVDVVNLLDETFAVLGQLVRVDDLTNFEGLTFDSSLAGQFVEISGLVNADGSILASLVKLEDMDTESDNQLKVEGVISNFNADTSRFELNGLSIDFSNAEFGSGTVDELGNEVIVRVKSSRDIVDGVLLADAIKIQKQDEDEDGAAGDPIVIEGVIDSLESPANFTVNGHRSLVNEATNYKDESSKADLVLNQRLRIKGVLNGDGIIVVESVMFQERHYRSMEGEIEAVDSSDGLSEGSSEGTLTMLGYTFHVNKDTHMVDSGSGRIRYFSLSDLYPGDRIEIKAAEWPGENHYLAVKIKRHHNHESDKIILSGPVTEINVDQAQFWLDGFLIQLGEDPEIGVHNGDDFNVSTFFDLLEEGFTVKVEGYKEGETVIAVEVRVKKNTDEYGDVKGDDDDGQDVDVEGDEDGGTDDTINDDDGNGQDEGQGDEPDEESDGDPANDGGQDSSDDNTDDGTDSNTG
jgi:hypothetical protein